MPGYVIHLCVAKEYVRKHGTKKEDDLIAGTIYPDLKTPKSKTHYAPCFSADTNLLDFLLAEKLDSSYQEGYFLHLLADCLFYHKYFSNWKTMDSKLLYNDYDILNASLIEKYNLDKVPKEVEKYFFVKKEGNTVEYHYDKVVQFIEEVSDYDIYKLAKEILLKKDYKFLLK